MLLSSPWALVDVVATADVDADVDVAVTDAAVTNVAVAVAAVTGHSSPDVAGPSSLPVATRSLN
jgi:hypothetical protein